MMDHTIQKTAQRTETVSLSTQQRLAAAMAAALLGSFLVFGVGLANSDTLHNAAHDGRHAFAFPCH
tara:strand:+ start:8408 stop:8605 length:198 start_codon:yes stop_codon:yes gene_type:complete